MDLDISNPELIKQLIATLQKLLPEQSTEKSEESIDEENNHNIKTKSRSSRRNKEQNKNKFTDMPEANMHKSDIRIDKKLNKYPPTPRNRPFKPVDVVCRVCGRKETVNPKIIPESIDRYKCNKCSSSGSK